MPHNLMKEKLLAGEPSIGVVSGLRSPLAAGVLARAGCSHVLIDGQHGEWDESSQRAGLAAVFLQGVTPVIRVTHNGYNTIGRALDAGALGIVVPMVSTAAEAQAAAFALRYPPRGGRSSGDNLTPSLGSDYSQWANDELLLAVQIETAEGLANAEAIMAVAGVDGCWLGPADLALSLGIEQGSPAHTEAVRRVLRACQAAGKVPGMFAGTPAIARRWIEEGYRFVTVSADSRLLEDAAQALMVELAAAGKEAQRDSRAV